MRSREEERSEKGGREVTVDKKHSWQLECNGSCGGGVCPDRYRPYSASRSIHIVHVMQLIYASRPAQDRTAWHRTVLNVTHKKRTCRGTGHMAPLCRMRMLCARYTRTQAQENSPPAPAHSRHAFAPHPTGCETSPICSPQRPYRIPTASVARMPCRVVAKTRVNVGINQRHVQRKFNSTWRSYLRMGLFVIGSHYHRDEECAIIVA